MIERPEEARTTKVTKPDSKNGNTVKILKQNGEQILIKYTDTGETRWVTKEVFISEFVTQRQSESELFMDTKMGEAIAITGSKIIAYKTSTPHLPWFLPTIQILLISSFIYLSYKIIKKQSN